MSSKSITIILISLVGILMIPTIAFGQQPDTTPPELLNFDFNPKIIDTSNASQDVEFTIEVKDDLSRIGSIDIHLLSEETAEGRWGYGIEFDGRDEEGNFPKEGVFKTTHSFPQYFPEGIYYVEVIQLHDNPEGYGGNYREITIDELREMGFPVELRNGLIENQPPVCDIKLQKNGIEIDEINIGESFDIYVGSSTDDIGIKEVRFSSDENQNGIVDEGFIWTDWYDWDTSKEDWADYWDATNKIKTWYFVTPGEKEVWAEVKNNIGEV